MYKKLNIRFYQNIAKLFYAIAAADKVVKPTEFGALKDFVKRQWLSVDTTEDDYKTDAAYQIEIVFDWLTTQHLDANSCYEDFVLYKKEHPYFFTKELNTLIIKTANGIATSFLGLNKSELIILAKLSLELKKP
jgi:hypothetical protein